MMRMQCSVERCTRYEIMIDEDRTLQLYGYTSAQLTGGSHKYVVAVCEECGRYRRSEMRRLRVVCHSCSMTGERSSRFGIRGKDHWNYGMTGEKSFNFGKRRTDEQKKRALRTRADTSGEKNPQYGKFGEEAGHWKGGFVEVTCYSCGSKIMRAPSATHDKNFCDLGCRRVYDETIENRISLSAMQQGIDVDKWIGFVPNNRRHVIPKYKCIQLNNYFVGSDAHHITKSIVIYIPSELHEHINHNLKNGYNMGTINMLALQFMM